MIGVRGGSVTIPCSFTYHTTTTWRIKDLTFVIFKQYYRNGELTTGYQDDGGIDKMKMFQGRVERMEKPEQGLWFLKINNLRVLDGGTYVCRFIYNESVDGKTWRRSGFEVRKGKQTKLRVDGEYIFYYFIYYIYIYILFEMRQRIFIRGFVERNYQRRTG